jgi:uncharacterized membrane protein YeaQ/YmgE (transglycosylase-associated protein family)
LKYEIASRERQNLVYWEDDYLQDVDARGPPDDFFNGQLKDIAMEFVWFILVGLVAGWLAGQIMRGGGFGVIGDIVVGVLGALLGGFLFGQLGMSLGGGLLAQIIVATLGAVILIFLLRLIR